MKTLTKAVIETMKNNGGHSSLKNLYMNVPKGENETWNTNNVDENIRRIVQNDKYFFKVKKGIWALIECKDILPIDIKNLMVKE